jgi:O-antigen ligase
MKESTKDCLGVTFGMCFVIGLIIFLTETRSTGEALQRLNVIVLWSTVSIVGIILGVVALVALVILYFPELKKTLKRKIG